MNDNIIKTLKKYLKNNLSHKRYEHTLSVYETAIKLANFYNVNSNKVKVAALGHDITKEVNFKEQEDIILKFYKGEEIIKVPPAWHSYTGVITLKDKFNINDIQILNAVKYHTLGHKDMDEIAKIIYVADFIEPTRKLLNLKYYQDLVYKQNYELDKVVYIILNDNLNYLKSQNNFIPKQSLEILHLLKSKYSTNK